jgi:hypothetical protein
MGRTYFGQTVGQHSRTALYITNYIGNKTGDEPIITDLDHDWWEPVA